MTIALRQRPLARVVQGIVQAAQGCWLDPSDLSTLYQDAAGTTPVTAVEQPVGKIIDKSGNNWHATQSITASRPTLSARKNVLLATETLVTQSVTSLAAQYTLSFTGTGSVTLSGTATGTLTGTGADMASLTFTPTAGTLTLTVSGSVTKAQLELGASAGPYQRVNTATDYDTDPRYFPAYLRFDGVDDYLNLPYMGLYAGGSASVVAALNSTASTQRYLIEGSTASASPWYGLLRNTNGNLGGAIVDDTSTPIVGNTYNPAFNINHVFSVVDSGSTLKTFDNSNLVDSDVYSRSGKTVTLNTTTIGAFVSTIVGSFSSMKLYGMIITKSTLTDSQRVACERHLSRKSGVTL